jgi:hypothetical protein
LTSAGSFKVVPGDLQRSLQFGQVVGDDDRSGALGNLNHRLHPGQGFIGQRSVRRAEIDGAGLDLLNAAAAADRLIVDLHIAVRLRVALNPALHDGIDERASRAGKIHGFRAAACVARGHADSQHNAASCNRKPCECSA